MDYSTNTTKRVLTDNVGPEKNAKQARTSYNPRSSQPTSQDSSQSIGGAKPRKPAKAKKTKNLTEPELCPEQADLVRLILSGRNVFYTGSAGCGKSTVLKRFVKELRAINKKVDIIAPTGRAALDINGSTTWTYAGWTPDHHKKPLLDLKKAAHGKFVRKRLRDTHVLIIDEISMVENHHFERLNEIMKEARANDSHTTLKAFGGVQLVVTGDFCQLPPVKPFQYCITCGKGMKQTMTSAGATHTCRICEKTWPDEDKWAFRSAAWQEADFMHVNLTNIHRQKDAKFINVLQKCRIGTSLTPKDTDLLLNHRLNKMDHAVKLFSTREEVRRVNQTEFDKLSSIKHTYTCHDYFWHNPQHPHLKWKGVRNEWDGSLKALSDHRFEPLINLKEGMLVILLVNLDLSLGLVNGSQGVITGFERYDPAKLPKKPTKKDADDENRIVGEYALIKEGNIKNFIESERNKDKLWPIVKFNSSNPNVETLTRTIFADCTINTLGDEEPYSLLSRTQIPLTAAWAMSIHKSQGMTLDKVVVDLSRRFEDGQMYVGLSRARTLQGLKVEGMKEGGGSGGGNEVVRQFLKEKFGTV